MRAVYVVPPDFQCPPCAEFLGLRPGDRIILDPADAHTPLTIWRAPAAGAAAVILQLREYLVLDYLDAPDPSALEQQILRQAVGAESLSHGAPPLRLVP